MNVLMLNYEFPPIGGGAASANLYLLREYAGIADLRVDVLTSGPEPGFFVEELGENITIYKMGLHKKSLHYWRRTEVIEWLFKARRCYRELVGNREYDLAHAFFGFPTGYLCYRTAEKLPYVISLRGSDVPGYNVRLGLDYRLLGGLFRRIWSRASAVVANSKGLAELALDFMPGLDIKIIPNGVDTERFYPAQERELGEPIRLLTVGRLIARKRIDVLIRAVGCARQLGVDARLTIAGDGNLLGQLRQLASESNLTDQIEFKGRVAAEDMPELYRGRSVFVMSSAHEGMSNAMLEAMASGLAIITTRCEGAEELIADNGIVVDPAGPEEIARAVKRLADDRELWGRMSAAAVERARQFAWKNAADQYLHQYRQVLHEK